MRWFMLVVFLWAAIGLLSSQRTKILPLQASIPLLRRDSLGLLSFMQFQYHTADYINLLMISIG